MIHETHRASQNIMLTASEIHTRVNMGPVLDEDWRAILRDITNIRLLAETLETQLRQSGRVPLVSLGQGDSRIDYYGNPVKSEGVCFG